MAACGVVRCGCQRLTLYRVTRQVNSTQKGDRSDLSLITPID